MYDDAIYEKYKETQSIPRDAFLFIHKFFNNGLCMPKALLDDLCWNFAWNLEKLPGLKENKVNKNS